jgi:hypothetical protein
MFGNGFIGLPVAVIWFAPNTPQFAAGHEMHENDVAPSGDAATVLGAGRGPGPGATPTVTVAELAVEAQRNALAIPTRARCFAFMFMVPCQGAQQQAALTVINEAQGA